MDNDRMLRRFKRVANAGIELENRLIEENKGRVGHFCHIIGNIVAPLVAVPIHVEKDGEELKEYIHRLKPGLRELRAYRDLLDREPEFKSGEMTEGYFNNLDKKPIGSDGKPRTIFQTGEYIQYAQEYFGFV